MKIAVVGFGFMGMTHTACILRNPELELVALVDKYPDNIRRKLTGNQGNFSTGQISEDALTGVSVYTSLEECLAWERPDACILSVHTDLHFELASQALEAGAHVFLEKPFTLSPDEGRQLISLAEEKGLVLMIGHVVRFMPPYLALKKWIDTGEFGRLKYLSLTRFSGLPAWGQWKDKRESFGSSGGALFDLVIHDIDYAHWVLGEPDEISAVCLPGALSNHDYVNAFWRYHSGLNIKIEGGNIFHTAYPFQAGFFSHFEKASVSWNTGDAGNIYISDDDTTRMVPAGDPDAGFSGELAYFFSCVKEGLKPMKCLPESSLRTIEICYRHII